MKKQAKKEEIIQAANKLIIEKGYRKTSVEDITHEAGIAKGSFYTYFKSKDSLIETLLLEQIDNRTKEITKVLKLDGTLEEVIKAYLNVYFNVSPDEAEFVLVMTTMLRSVDSVGDIVIERLEKDKRERREEFIEILKKYKNEIDIKDEEDYERYALFVFALINAFYINNLCPNGNRFGKSSLEEIRERINAIDRDYEVNFMANIILKMILKK